MNNNRGTFGFVHIPHKDSLYAFAGWKWDTESVITGTNTIVAFEVSTGSWRVLPETVDAANLGATYAFRVRRTESMMKAKTIRSSEHTFV